MLKEHSQGISTFARLFDPGLVGLSGYLAYLYKFGWQQPWPLHYQWLI